MKSNQRQKELLEKINPHLKFIAQSKIEKVYHHKGYKIKFVLDTSKISILDIFTVNDFIHDFLDNDKNQKSIINFIPADFIHDTPLYIYGFNFNCIDCNHGKDKLLTFEFLSIDECHE